MSTQIRLPLPSQKGSMSLEEAIARRKSIRNFAPEPISQSQLSQILWATQGISGTSGRYRTVPSAGATYPLEIFIACGKNGVEEIDDGIYHYDIAQHSLTLRHKGDIRLELARQHWSRDSSMKPRWISLSVPYITGPLPTMAAEGKGMSTWRWDTPGRIFIFKLPPLVWQQ